MKIETILGPRGMSIIDDQIRRLPPDLPDWQKSVRLDHIYTRTMLLWCQANDVASLRQIRAKRQGRIFCSNEEIGPARAIGEGRVSNQILLEDDCDERIEVFGKGGGHAVAQTLSRLTGADVPLLGEIPIDLRLREAGDDGVPLVLAEPEAPAAAELIRIAQSLGTRSRSLAGVVPLDAAINRSTSSVDKQRGSLASRQCATAGIAIARSSRHSPRKLRYRRKARREVINFCVVGVPHWLACSRRKFRTDCAFHWPTSSPSARAKSVAPRAYCRSVGSLTPRCVRNQSQKAVTRAGAEGAS